MSNKVVNNSKKERKAEEQKLNDVAVNRVMILFTLTVVGVVVLNILRNVVGKNEYIFVLNVLPFVQIGTALLVAAAAIWFYLCRKNNVDETYRLFKSSYVLGTAITIFVPALLYKYTHVTGAIVIMVAALVLCYVYNFYPRDFYMYSILTAVGAVLMYAAGLGKAYLTLFTIVKIAAGIVAIAVAIATLAVTLKVRKCNGKLEFFGKKISFGGSFKYYPFVIGAVILLLGTIVSFVAGAATVYALCAFFAAYLVIAIIYSIKMI